MYKVRWGETAGTAILASNTRSKMIYKIQPPPHPHLCTFPKISAALCIINMILSSTPPLHLDNCCSVFDCNMKPMPRAAIRPRIFDRNSTHTHRDTAHPPCTYST